MKENPIEITYLLKLSKDYGKLIDCLEKEPTKKIICFFDEKKDKMEWRKMDFLKNTLDFDNVWLFFLLENKEERKKKFIKFCKKKNLTFITPY